MSDWVHYRSEHPAVARYDAQKWQQIRAWIKRVVAFGKEFVINPDIRIHGSVAERYVIGFRGDTAPGPHWHRKRGQDYWTPDGRTKAGRELWARMRALTCTKPQIPGFPRELFSPSRSEWAYPIFIPNAGEFWIGIRATYEEVEADPAFDSTIWQRSTWDTYREAKYKPRSRRPRQQSSATSAPTPRNDEE